MNKAVQTIVDMARKGVRPVEIARILGLENKLVHNRICSARRAGIDLPHFTTKGAPQPKRRVPIPVPVRELLEPAAQRRGMDVFDLAALIVKVVAEEDMVDAVLDDGSRDD